MPFEAFKPVFKALPKLGFVGLAPALVITQCHKYNCYTKVSVLLLGAIGTAGSIEAFGTVVL